MHNRFVCTRSVSCHRTVEVYPLGMFVGHFCIQGHWCAGRLWRVVIWVGPWIFDLRPIDGRRFSRLGDCDWDD